MDKNNLAFGKINFILLAVGVAIIILGFLMMSGGQSTEKFFDATIFNDMRIKVAPVVTFIGFVSIIVAIIVKPKTTDDDFAQDVVESKNAKTLDTQDASVRKTASIDLTKAKQTETAGNKERK